MDKRRQTTGAGGIKDLSILVLEDRPGDQAFLEEALASSRADVSISLVDSMGELNAKAEGKCDIVLLNLSMGQTDILETISAVVENFPGVPVVVMAGLSSHSTALDSLRLGAEDFIVKGDFTAAGLERILRHSVERFALKHELERATQDLVREKQASSDYFEIAPVINVALDTDGVVTRINSKGARILECDKESAVGLNWFETFLPDSNRAAIQEAFKWIVEEKIGSDEVIEHAVSTLKKNIRWIRWQSTIVRDAAGEIVGLMSLGEDVTEQRAAREELRVSEEKYRQVVENAGQAIVVAQDAILKYVNPIACKMLGTSVKDILEKPFIEFIAEEDREMVADRYRRRLAGEDLPGRYSFRIRRSDDVTTWVEIDSVLINWNSRPATLNFLTDITDRIRAEAEKGALQAQLILSQKLEAVGRLAGGVAHDFNNLLSVINSAAVFLMDEVQEGTEMHQDVSDIKEAADKAAALTRQLLALSRRQVMEPRLIDPGKTIENLQNMLGRLLGEDVEIVVNNDGKGGMIKADPGQLEQVLVNLAINSRDAMPSGGKLTIETYSTQIRERDAWKISNVTAGLHVVIAVTDTGEGIDETNLSHIFEPFFTTKSKGSGLGLATVYGIVAQSGGGISVISSPGSGTRFEIYLPRETEGSAEIRSDLPPPITGVGSETILVVEDDKMVRHVAARSLERSGYKVLEASNAGEALLTCDSYEGRIHLVLSDVVMPFMVGPDMVPRLLQIRPEMKVVYMSGYMERDIVKRLEDGKVPFIIKPFSPEGLVETIRSTLDAPAPTEG